jgi:long-chain acyl-CoA synthetase
MLKENIVKEIESSILNNWDQPAISDYGGKPISYGNLGRRIIFWHSVFKETGIVPGDKIAITGRNSVGWAEVFLSTITYGAIAVPILSDFAVENIHNIIAHSDSKFLFASDSMYESLDPKKMRTLEAVFSLNDFNIRHFANDSIPAQTEKTRIHFSENFKDLPPEKFSLPDIGMEKIAAIVYTSGTTGFSKGVMLSHNSLTANIIYAQKNMPLQPGDRILSFLPLAHSYACAFEFLFPISIGCHITFLNKLPTPQLLLKAFDDVKPRLVFLVPLLIEKIFKSKIKPMLEKPVLKAVMKLPGIKNIILSRVRQKLVTIFGGNFIEVIIGGAALNPEVEDFLISIRFPFTIGYGMTECGPLISYAPWDGTKRQSVGKPIDYLDVTIKKEGNQEIGEILVKGENVMSGYYKNEDATRDAIDADGWLHTGDLGLVDLDRYIFIKGRCKNLILGPSGQNIYPEDIEAKLNIMPGVQESLVLESNGKLVALVYPDLEIEGPTDEDSLAKKMSLHLEQINRELPVYSRLSEIKLYPEEFEKTPTKKIKRYLYDIQ